MEVSVFVMGCLRIHVVQAMIIMAPPSPRAQAYIDKIKALGSNGVHVVQAMIIMTLLGSTGKRKGEVARALPLKNNAGQTVLHLLAGIDETFLESCLIESIKKLLTFKMGSGSYFTEIPDGLDDLSQGRLPHELALSTKPMDQGVIVAFKRLYKRRQLESCLVFSSDADQPNNSVGEQTFSNLKKYDIKKAIFNFGNSWDELKSSTIRNGWKILLEHKNNSDLETAGDALQLSEDESDEDEQEIRRLEQLFQRARIEVNQESINEWIDIDLDDPGHNVLSNDDIVEAVLSEKMEISSSDDSSSTSEDSLEPDVPRCEALKSLDVALKYLEKRTEPEMLASYNTINSLRTMLMREEEALLNKPKKQTTISNFFAKP
ncbi:TIGD7 [Cordylochernes scorpioides]|uniref:TIGD7 n=1 Tax=Cordylochernes scorpioides TaxID=51811 RepID=A0ABY6KEH8_9ARAC|nr:TIGD7 [Cordylochernes scorpioides]